MSIFLITLPFVFFILIIMILVFIDPVRKRMKALNGSMVNILGEGIFEVDGKKVSLRYVRGSKGRAPTVRLSIEGVFGAELVIRT